ncbi:hypothetical protein M758_12G066200 [Ceratodon purpureus]|nr:hypothetical protein M758_12G066200 [Ceratodon purpureus]
MQKAHRAIQPRDSTHRIYSSTQRAITISSHAQHLGSEVKLMLETFADIHHCFPPQEKCSLRQIREMLHMKKPFCKYTSFVHLRFSCSYHSPNC